MRSGGSAHSGVPLLGSGALPPEGDDFFVKNMLLCHSFKNDIVTFPFTAYKSSIWNGRKINLEAEQRAQKVGALPNRIDRQCLWVKQQSFCGPNAFPVDQLKHWRKLESSDWSKSGKITHLPHPHPWFIQYRTADGRAFATSPMP